MSCKNVAPTQTRKPKTPSILDGDFRILDLPARHLPHIVTSHGSAFKEEGAGSVSANFDGSITSIHDEEYYRALDRWKFAKKQEYVIFCLIDKPRQPTTRPKYRVQ